MQRYQVVSLSEDSQRITSYRESWRVTLWGIDWFVLFRFIVELKSGEESNGNEYAGTRMTYYCTWHAKQLSDYHGFNLTPCILFFRFFQLLVHGATQLFTEPAVFIVVSCFSASRALFINHTFMFLKVFIPEAPLHQYNVVSFIISWCTKESIHP